ncbi:MAG TPA: Uma2 family endonuclease [Tepidisphaeraceae bacterium]|nr:Uma2 family endonuclease [Tepidisphaeraceae bacterium]
MGVPATKRRYTIAEYLRMEERARDRHEFHDGEILAMSGGTYGHSRVNANFLANMHAALKGKPSHPLDSNMRVRIPGRLSYLYPDISVVCGPPQFDPDDPNKTTIINPRVVVEVLSNSTESYDRGAKFDLYGEISTLQEYVLVSQQQPLIETFLRRPKGVWLFTPFKGIKASVKLASLKICLPLKDVYDGLEFDSPEAEGGRAAG